MANLTRRSPRSGVSSGEFVATDVASVDFDPVQEMRQLRQSFANRVEQIQGQPSNSQTGKAGAPILLVEKAVAPRHSELIGLSIAQPEKPEGARNLVFCERLDRMKETLARLPISSHETLRGSLYGSVSFQDRSVKDLVVHASAAEAAMPAFLKTLDGNVETQGTKGQSSKEQGDATHPRNQAAWTFDVLDWAHVCMTLLGFLGIVGGFVLCAHHRHFVSQPGFILIIAGAVVISLGFSSRLFTALGGCVNSVWGGGGARDAGIQN